MDANRVMRGSTQNGFAMWDGAQLRQKQGRRIFEEWNVAKSTIRPMDSAPRQAAGSVADGSDDSSCDATDGEGDSQPLSGRS